MKALIQALSAGAQLGFRAKLYPGCHGPPQTDRIRLLPGLDLERVRRAGKPLIGYLTTLHGVWARCGVQGRLLGGNLAVLVSSLGTVAQPDLRGALLFLEDISEDPCRVDRYLTQLLLAGVLHEVAGFLLGRFSEADNADAVMAERLHALGKPVQMDVASRSLRG